VLGRRARTALGDKGSLATHLEKTEILVQVLSSWSGTQTFKKTGVLICSNARANINVCIFGYLDNISYLDGLRFKEKAQNKNTENPKNHQHSDIHSKHT